MDDISTLDEYRVALKAGLTQEEALRAVTLPGAVKKVLLNNSNQFSRNGNQLLMEGWQTVALELE